MVLDEEGNSHRKSRVWTTAILLVIFLLLFLVFRREIGLLFRIIGAGLGIPLFTMPSLADLSRSLGVTIYNCLFGFLPVFFLWLFLFSKNSILPVFRADRDTPGVVTPEDDQCQRREHERAAWQLFLYMLKLHGPAVSIKNGEISATVKDLERKGPGIVVVDFNSAIALEEQVPAPSLVRGIKNMIYDLLVAFDLMEPYTSPRVCGPGLVFTRPRERIRGVVDLRKQFRIERNAHGYTRDGIEVTAKVNAAFTTGQDADILNVTFIGGKRLENLRVLTLNENTHGHITIRQISDDLSAADRSQIFNDLQALSHIPLKPFRVAETMPNIPIFSPLRVFTQIPAFDEARVFNAIYSEARDSNELLSPWDQLPVQVAKGFFPEFISRYNYDELYSMDQPSVFPMEKAQSRFQAEMRNRGILAYRFMAHVSGEDLQVNVRYPVQALRQYAPSPLTFPAVLRNRGIKIISSKFSDLTPVSDVIYQQRLDNWRAPWQRDTDSVLAEGELDAMRIRSKSRTQTRRDMVETLHSILNDHPHATEANAIQVFQALEMAATNPNTNKLLPQDTIAILRILQSILLSERTPEGPK